MNSSHPHPTPTSPALPRVGVCSWSLQPASPQELAGHLQSLGVSCVQLALEPIRNGTWGEIETMNCLRAAGVSVVSGMMETAGEDYSTLETIKHTGGIRPSTSWLDNQGRAIQIAKIASRLKLPLVSFHAGFIPHSASDPERRVMIERLQEIADIFDDHDVRIAFETGQESAATLLEVLEEMQRPFVGINFDPANMILYGMGDPIAALDALSSRVVQVHIKDALPTKQPGTWGSEVRAGTGAVDWPKFFEVIRKRLLAVDLIVEREAGDQRVQDIAEATELVRTHIGNRVPMFQASSANG